MEQETLQLPLNDRLFTWFETNRKNVVIFAVVAVVATFVIFFYLDAQHKKQVAAGEALARALMNEYLANGKVTSPDGMLKVATEKAGTQAGGQAVLLAAGALFTQGKFPEAQAQFERFMKEYPGNLFAPQAMLGVASSLHAQGKLDLALTAYKGAERPGSSTATQAKFGQASIYAAQGKPDLALTLYESIFMELREDRSNPLGSEAAMRAMELRAKMPAPAYQWQRTTGRADETSQFDQQSSRQVMNSNLPKQLDAEFIGTFTLILVGGRFLIKKST